MPVEMVLLLAAAKGALLLGVALLLMRASKRASAAMRHAILFAAIVGALLLPLLSRTLPTFSPLWGRSRAVAAHPKLQRWSDNAILLFLRRSDAAPCLLP